MPVPEEEDIEEIGNADHDEEENVEELAAVNNISAIREIPETDELKPIIDKASASNAVSKKKALFAQLQVFFRHVE